MMARLLTNAAERGDLDECRRLHAVHAYTLHDLRDDENSALRVAAENGHFGVCRWLHATFHLTAADARVNDNYALSYAAYNGHLRVCRWLHATCIFTGVKIPTRAPATTGRYAGSPTKAASTCASGSTRPST